MAMAVFVLQALAIERGAPGRATQQEATRLHITRRPGQITDALKAKHRVVDIERHHDAVICRVRGCCCNPRTERTGLVNALLQ